MSEDIHDAREYLEPLLGRRGIEVRETHEGQFGLILRLDNQIIFSPELWVLDRARAPAHAHRPTST